MRHSLALFAIVLAASFIARGEEPEYVPALKGLTVNGEKVSAEEVRGNYDEILHYYKAPGKPLSKELKDKIAEKARERTISHKAVAQYILKNKLDIDAAGLKSEIEELKAEFEAEGNSFGQMLKGLSKSEDEFAKEYTPRAIMRRHAAAQLGAADEKAALKKKFEEGKDKIPLRQVSHILTSFEKCKYTTHPERTREDAQRLAGAALIRVKAGEDFAGLAKELSDDNRTKDKGGDLGWIKPADMPKPFSDAAYALAKVGDTSEIIESELGLHVIKLTGVRPEDAAFEQFVKLAVKKKTLGMENQIAAEAKVEDDK